MIAAVTLLTCMPSGGRLFPWDSSNGEEKWWAYYGYKVSLILIPGKLSHRKWNNKENDATNVLVFSRKKDEIKNVLNSFWCVYMCSRVLYAAKRIHFCCLTVQTKSLKFAAGVYEWLIKSSIQYIHMFPFSWFNVRRTFSITTMPSIISRSIPSSPFHFIVFKSFIHSNAELNGAKYQVKFTNMFLNI